MVEPALEFVGRLEIGNSFGRHINRGAGPGIPRQTGPARLDLEAAEPAKFHFVATDKGLTNVFHDQVDDDTGVLLTDACLLGDDFDKFRFGHSLLPDSFHQMCSALKYTILTRTAIGRSTLFVSYGLSME